MRGQANEYGHNLYTILALANIHKLALAIYSTSILVGVWSKQGSSNNVKKLESNYYALVYHALVLLRMYQTF